MAKPTRTPTKSGAASPPPRRSSRTAVVGVVAGAGLAALLIASADGDGATSAPAPTAAAPTPAAPRRDAPPPRAAAAPAAAEHALDPSMLSAAALREALAQYERDSIYPPTSHLWTEDTAGQNQPWNQTFPVEHLLDDRDGQETVFRFASDRHHVEHGEALTATIEVWPQGARERRLPVTFHSAIVEAFGTGRTGVTLTFRDDGADGDAVAGDRRYTARLVPSEHAALERAQRVRLQVDLEAAGVQRLAHLDFTYTPRPLLDLVGVEAGPEDGHLAVALALDVHDPGHYQISADVLAEDGVTPIGWITHPWEDLDVGRRTVTLTLFGKVLHDRGLAGPYVIANLRAERRADDAEVEMWWSDPRTFRTAAVGLDAFSPAPWDGPERRTAIATIQASIAEQEATERGAWQPPGSPGGSEER